MTCRMFIEFLLEYLDGTLAAEERAVFLEHLGECEACTAYLANYRETIRLAQLACEDPESLVPSSIPEELVQAILAARPEMEQG